MAVVEPSALVKHSARIGVEEEVLVDGPSKTDAATICQGSTASELAKARPANANPPITISRSAPIRPASRGNPIISGTSTRAATDHVAATAVGSPPRATIRIDRNPSNAAFELQIARSATNSGPNRGRARMLAIDDGAMPRSAARAARPIPALPEALDGRAGRERDDDERRGAPRPGLAEPLALPDQANRPAVDHRGEPGRHRREQPHRDREREHVR